MFVDKSLANDGVIEPLCEFKTSKTEEPCERYQYRLKLMSSPKLYKSLVVRGFNRFNHISCVTSDLDWVNDITGSLINTSDDTLYHLLSSEYCGPFTVSSKNELIYIDRKTNINKLSSDRETITTLLTRTDSSWKPLCVYSSPSTGD